MHSHGVEVSDGNSRPGQRKLPDDAVPPGLEGLVIVHPRMEDKKILQVEESMSSVFRAIIVTPEVTRTWS